MSHEDFARYVSEGSIIAGHAATLAAGEREAHILKLNRSTEISLQFESNEGFESRMEKVAAAIQQWEERRSAA